MGGLPGDLLRDLRSWRVTEVPRRPGGPEDLAGGDEGLAQRLAALVSAYHSGAGPVALGWLRLAEGGPVHVLGGGASLAGRIRPGFGVPLSLPAGGRGQPIAAGTLAEAFGRVPCWVRIAGLAEGIAGDAARPGPGPGEPGLRRGARPSLEDGLLAVWPGAFGWLVLAEPAGARLLDAAAEEAQSRLRSAQSYADRSADVALLARRLQGRHGELRQAAATGMWRVHLLAGGPTPEAAGQVAGLVCASADLEQLPYSLLPVRGAPGSLGDVLDAAASVSPGGLPGGGLSRPPAAYGAAADPGVEEAVGIGQPLHHAPAAALSPFYGSGELLAALARPPGREVPGLRFVLRPDFDVTPEAPPGGAGAGVVLGQVLDRQRAPAGELAVPLASLNRHAFVCGATGSGKSQTIRHLLEQATAAGVPWLVIEPAKAEYRLMAARLPGTEVIAIRPGEPGGIPAGISPLEPAAGPDGTRFPVQAHADLVRALFLAAFEAEEPFPQVLASALTHSYEQAGWDLALGEPAAPGVIPAWPTLGDLQQAAVAVVEEIGYGREVTDNVRGFITVRLSSLRLGTTGRFFEGGHELDFTRLLARNVVLEIEDAGDDHDKAFLMGTVLIRLAEHLRMRRRAEGPAMPGLAHLTVVEEAHRLLRAAPPGQRGAAGHAVEMFAGLLAEVRAYGEGLVIAEQIPAKLIPDVIKNTAVKIVHRLPAADDRDTVGATMNLTEDQSRFLVTLPPGEAAVFTDGMDFPLLARIPDGTARELAAPAIAVPPAGVVDRRSVTCGPDCMASPCTLRDMRAAQRVLEAEKGIVAWAEFSVLGHLAGWHMPAPAPPLRAALAAMPDRLRDCALSQAADAAVASRIPVISGQVSPAALAAHVTTAMRAGLDEGRWACDPSEPQWLAPAYRWAIILDDLAALVETDPGAGRHPDTACWEQATGRPVPGADAAAQLRAVRAWHDEDARDPAVRDAIAFGTRVPAAIETAAGARRGDSDWDQRLAAVLDWFTDCPWPLTYLASPPAGTRA